MSHIPEGTTLKDSEGNEIDVNSDGSYSVVTDENGNAAVTLVSDTELEDSALNNITASVTSIETESLNIATTVNMDNTGMIELSFNGDTSIDLSTLANEDAVNNIAKITLEEGKQEITLSIEDVLGVANENNKLLIEGDSTDDVTLKGEWENTGTETVDGTEYSVYQGSGADGSTANVLIDINQNNIHIDES